jgi:hypothetical protein
MAGCCGALLVLSSTSVRADATKEQCVKANADGQVARMSGKFDEARALLATCGEPSCPSMVRSDCAQRLDDLERAQPTIVFDVKDATGADISAVSVTVDGKPLAGRITGTALRADPGDHVFTFTAPGQATVTRHFVLKEGEKDRRERIEIGAATPAAGTPPAPASTEPPPADSAQGPASDTAPSSGMGTQKILGLVAGGIGVAGIALGSVFGIETFSAVSQQKTDCQSASSCSNHAQALNDHSTASSDGTIATIGLAAGGALLATGAILFFTAPHASDAQSTGLLISPSVGPAGGGLSLRTEF